MLSGMLIERRHIVCQHQYNCNLHTIMSPIIFNCKYFYCLRNRCHRRQPICLGVEVNIKIKITICERHITDQNYWFQYLLFEGYCTLYTKIIPIRIKLKRQVMDLTAKFKKFTQVTLEKLSTSVCTLHVHRWNSIINPIGTRWVQK